MTDPSTPGLHASIVCPRCGDSTRHRCSQRGCPTAAYEAAAAARPGVVLVDLREVVQWLLIEDRRQPRSTRALAHDMECRFGGKSAVSEPGIDEWEPW